MLVRLFALIIIYVIPGAIAAYGFKLMRDTLYLYFDPNIHTFQTGQFLFGAVLFIVGVSFIGGYILHKDRKRRLVQPRFRKEN
jgi:predicted membrane protein